MAKNIKISVDIFRQKWFRELTPDRKVLWLFLMAESDLIGVFEVDAGVWNFICKPEQAYNADDPFWVFGNRIQRVPKHADKGIIVGKLDYQRNFSTNSSQWKWVERALSDVGLTYEKLQKMREKEEEQLVLKGIVEPKQESTRAKPIEERKMIPPPFEMVKAYCESRASGIDAQHFYDFYESKGWRVGNERMKDWQAAVRTWEGRSKPSRKNDAAALDASTQVVRKVY